MVRLRPNSGQLDVTSASSVRAWGINAITGTLGNPLEEEDRIRLAVLAAELLYQEVGPATPFVDDGYGEGPIDGREEWIPAPDYVWKPASIPDLHWQLFWTMPSTEISADSPCEFVDGEGRYEYVPEAWQSYIEDDDYEDSEFFRIESPAGSPTTMATVGPYELVLTSKWIDADRGDLDESGDYLIDLMHYLTGWVAYEGADEGRDCLLSLDEVEEIAGDIRIVGELVTCRACGDDVRMNNDSAQRCASCAEADFRPKQHLSGTEICVEPMKSASQLLSVMRKLGWIEVEVRHSAIIDAIVGALNSPVGRGTLGSQLLEAPGLVELYATNEQLDCLIKLW